MDAYTDTSFWENTPAFTQLPDSDFFALLQKQFPPAEPFVGVNPQNLSSYSLPSLTPSSGDSSPSPSNSHQDVFNDDVNEPPLKRKASGEEFSDNPNQKTQHTGKYYHILNIPFLLIILSLKFR
jgi:AP-1-like factor